MEQGQLPRRFGVLSRCRFHTRNPHETNSRFSLRCSFKPRSQYISHMSTNHGPLKSLQQVHSISPHSGSISSRPSLHLPVTTQVLRHTNALNASSQVSLLPLFFLFTTTLTTAPPSLSALHPSRQSLAECCICGRTRLTAHKPASNASIYPPPSTETCCPTIAAPAPNSQT